MATNNGSADPFSTLPAELELPMEFLSQITNGFSDERKISESVFGTVYKGVIKDGEFIAVKKLATNSTVPAGKQFLTVAANLMAVQHKNVLQLRKYGSESKKQVMEHNGKYILVDTGVSVLCYEYTPNGSLREYLERPPIQSTDQAKKTDWDTSFNIIKGICQGLYFLHQEMGAPIVHLDIQPATILLDDDMVPKIADFGLSRLFGHDETRIKTLNVVGARGYMAPEYLYSGEISPQCDIYSLGVLILEITTRENNCSNDKDLSASNFILDIREKWTDNNGNIDKGHILSKYSFLDADHLQQVETCIEIALKCVDVDQKKRPSIQEVVTTLAGAAYTTKEVSRFQHGQP